MRAVVTSAPMSKAAAMTLYNERRRRTAVLHLDLSASCRRTDIVAALSTTVECTNIEAVGQLYNNMTWDVVLCDEDSKKRLVDGNMRVSDKPVTVIDMRPQAYVLRLLRIPTCVPNEFIAAELKKVEVVVMNLGYEVDKSDGLMSNVRVCTFECRDVEDVPDTMQWRFDGLTGRALLFVRGRRPRCHRCGDRSHKVATCTTTASASVMRADNMEDDDSDEEEMQTVDVSPPAGPTVTAVKETSESGPESSHNAAVASTLAV